MGMRSTYNGEWGFKYPDLAVALLSMLEKEELIARQELQQLRDKWHVDASRPGALFLASINSLVVCGTSMLLSILRTATIPANLAQSTTRSPQGILVPQG